VTLASIVADTLVAHVQPQLATWADLTGANESSDTPVLAGAKFGLPADSTASFTSGGASQPVGARGRADAGVSGYATRLAALPAQPTVYLTAEAHHSFSKIAHMTGRWTPRDPDGGDRRRSADGSR